MQIPSDLRIAIDRQIEKHNHKDIIENAKSISKKYRTRIATGKGLVQKENEAVAYSISRMPATYGAVFEVFNKNPDFINSNFQSLLDVGAGTGTATWVADSVLSLEKIICIERESAMIQIGQILMRGNDELNEKCNWIKADIVNDNLEGLNSDLVIMSYSLNEMKNEDREVVLEKLWNLTNETLIIIEPGTPTGYMNIMSVRDYLISKEATLVAPCTHNGQCPLINCDGEWCHFIARVNRTKLHMQMKNGVVPYEDEKFSYIIFSKNNNTFQKNFRVIKTPIRNKGFVNFTTCTDNGIVKNTITKKEKEKYKIARKLEIGDLFEY